MDGEQEERPVSGEREEGWRRWETRANQGVRGQCKLAEGVVRGSCLEECMSAEIKT